MVDAPRETKEQVPLTLELDCPPGVVRRDRLSRRPEVDTPTKEACVGMCSENCERRKPGVDLPPRFYSCEQLSVRCGLYIICPRRITLRHMG